MTLETSITMSDETLDALKSLIQANLDSRDGFRHAAEHIEEESLASAFAEIADQRAEQAEELQHFVSLNEREPRAEGSWAASVHRGWVQIRELLSRNDRRAVLAECERGEDRIKSAYEHALRSITGSPVNDLLQRHYVAVKRTHDAVRDLRDAA